ncbi:hypothetical protein [Avibacterium endocarditidis]|nr:hypothetical protein [Avibacterium endocarditidis]
MDNHGGEIAFRAVEKIRIFAPHFLSLSFPTDPLDEHPIEA